MAIGTPTWATAVRVNGSTTVATTASITPAGSDVAIACISWQGNIVVGSAPTFTMSNGAGWGTLATGWTQMCRIAVAMDNSASYSLITEIWMCKLGGSPSGGTVTATCSGAPTDSSFFLEVGNVSGADVPGSPNTGTVHPAFNNVNATVALTSAPAASSMWVGVIGSTAASTITQPSGTSEASENIDSGFGVCHETAYLVGSASQSNQWSWSGGAFFGSVAAAVEIPVAAGGGGAVPEFAAAWKQRPPGRISPAGRWSPASGVSDAAVVAYTGTANVAETVNITASATTAGTGTATETVSITAAGSATGSASVAEAVTITASGQVATSASASVSETVTVTAAGTVATSTSANVSETVTITAAGMTSNSASVTETITITAAGTVSSPGSGSAQVTETITVTATGLVATTATASVSETITITAAGTVSATATRTETVTITAAGGASATATRTTTATVTASGQLATFTGATVAQTVTITATGVVVDPNAIYHNLTGTADPPQYAATVDQPQYQPADQNPADYAATTDAPQYQAAPDTPQYAASP